MTTPEFGPFVTNKENAAELWHWLNDGAPHTAFNIEFALETSEEDSFINYAVRTEEKTGQKIEPSCGTICCIAGAAALMDKGLFGASTKEQYDFETGSTWVSIQGAAIRFIGLKVSELDQSVSNDMGIISLFDPEDVPGNPTGQQAAQALVNYSNHQDPLWDEVMEVEA